MTTLVASPLMTDAQADKLYKNFIDESYMNRLITEDVDIKLPNGKLLARFRKNVLSMDLLKLGVDSFRGSIGQGEMRGAASGFSGKVMRQNGKLGTATVGNKVESGMVGYMDAAALTRYCRKTAFTHAYFETFKQGIPFVKRIDELYEELAPQHYRKQKAIARRSDKNYVIADTAFTTITVNKNFQTAVHKDAGDFPDGFGNLIAHRTGNWGGSYFVLPQYGIGFDLQNMDVLFVDVHQWHGNTPFKNFDPERGDERISFVLYYRENIVACKAPKDELARIKKEGTGFIKL